MKILFRLFLWCYFFCYTCFVEAQFVCNASLNPPVTLNNGIMVTSESIGTNFVFTEEFTSCVFDPGQVTTPTNSIWLGYNSIINYSLSFSQAINFLYVNITATGQVGDEFFTFTTDNGIPAIVQIYGCFSSVNGNVITSGANSGNVGSAGGQFLITSSNSFTQLTITGPNSNAGSLFSFCQNSIIPACPQNLNLSSPNDDVSNISIPVVGLRHRSASQAIIASNLVAFGDNSAQNGVVYHAGNFVELNVGFEGVFGSKFSGYIEGCSNNFQYRQASSSSSTNFSNKKKSNLLLYPNPTNDKVEIKLNNQMFKKVSIATIDGKMMFESDIEKTDKFILDVSRFAQGIYIINVVSENGEIQSQKLIKK